MLELELKTLEEIRNKIILTMKKNNITYKFVADKLGISKQTIYESLQKDGIRLSTLIKVVKIIQEGSGKT